MGKRKHQRKSKTTQPASTDRGFEFGHLRRTLFANTSSIEFNNHLTDAGVTGCGYGYHEVAGFPAPLPALTIIGQKADKLLAASEILKEWGCESDGDVVDIEIVLRRDGTYLFGMQPNLRRGLFRMSKDQDLLDVLFVGGSWIKKIDSTNPILRGWKDAARSKLFPMSITMSTAQLKYGIPQQDTLRLVPGALSFVKLDTKIVSEDEAPDHLMLDIVNRRERSPGKPHDAKPHEVARRRQRVIDSAFPVSRDRVRRLKLYERTMEFLKTDGITPAQVAQAAINVQLSREWCRQDHYPFQDFSAEEWWNRIFNRVEMTTLGNTLADIEVAVVARQLELDVTAVLRGHGAVVADKYKVNQRQFVRLGYGGN